MRSAFISILIIVITVIAVAAAFGSDKKATSKRPARSRPVSVSGMNAPEGVQLIAWVENEVAGPDEPNLLWLSVRNTTKKVLYLHETYAEREYKFDVRDEKGEIVPFTKDGENLVTNDAIYMRGTIKLKPSERVQHNVTINRLYDMTKPGIYSITVRRKIIGEDGGVFSESISNTIKVTVGP